MEYVFGWVEAQRDGDPVLRPVNPTPCPEFVPDVTWLAGMAPAEQLRCFADDTLEVTGYLALRSAPGTSYDGEPDWLADEAAYVLEGNRGPAVSSGMVELHFPPDVDPTDQLGRAVRIRGHFDDEASANCSRAPAAESVPDQSTDEERLWCRQQFVVDTIQGAE